MAKILLAMSGGVDSSVAAALLVEAGHEVVGCFMRLGSAEEGFDPDAPQEAPQGACDASRIRAGHRGCCSLADADDARRVAAHLGIPLYVCNFKRDFRRIVDYFVSEYNAGRTPNPCVRCNDWLKFGKLHDYARQIGARYVASGHYARIDRSGPHGPRLCRGLDRGKDQSYVLFGAPRERLNRMLLPLGEHRKLDVRRLARQRRLPVSDKPDSQEICFVPDRDYAGLVARRSPGAVEPGPIVDTAGRVVGDHAGHQHYTVGQRRGLGVALGYPLYVVHRDARSNTVTIGSRRDLMASRCRAAGANWLVDPPGRGWRRCSAKVRSNGEPAPAEVRRGRHGEMEVRFARPQFAVAPGQAVVCYDGEVVLGGAWIVEAS